MNELLGNGKAGVKGYVKGVVRHHSRLVGSLVAVRTNEPVVVLTFDDGPETGGTEGVLSALDQHAATGTFFVLISRCRRNPGLLREVAAAGHEIALHGMDHRRLTGFPPAEVFRRTIDARSELEDLVGERVQWLRPPYGRQTLGSWRAVKRAGLLPVMWGPSTWDSQKVTDEQRLTAATRGIAAGSILLAHDGFAGPEDGVDDGPAPSIDRGVFMSAVLDEYQNLGLSGRSLADALVSGSEVLAAWFKR